MTPKYEAYLKTDYWKAVSDAVKKRAGYRCQLCNSQHDLAAHHRTYDHRGREMEFLDDLTCLCRRCHEIFHGKSAIESHAEKIADKPPAMLTKRQRREAREKIRAGLTNIRPHTEAEVEAEMPPGEEIELTRELLNLCRTNGTFTTATIDALGVNGHMTYGWVQRLYGAKMPRRQFRQALEGKYVYANPRFHKGGNEVRARG